jgi:LPS-assembly lipoprotein
MRNPTRRSVLGATGLLLTGCNLRPLYWTDARGRDLRPELASVDVRAPDNRVGWLLANAVREELNPTSRDVPARFLLDIGLESRTANSAIDSDADVTRFNYTLRADAVLRAIGSDEVLFETQVRRVTSYNLVRQPFASLISGQDAERRAAEDIAKDLRTRVAAFLRRQASTTTT